MTTRVSSKAVAPLVSSVVTVVALFLANERAAAQDVGAVNGQFTAAYQAKNWDKAIELGQKLCELAPKGGINQYNLACCYALSGNKPKALEWLDKAVDAGFSDD